MKKRGKALVIEDKKIWSNRLRRVLKEHGFYVIVAESENEAIKLLEEEKFHIITVDLQLNDETEWQDDYEGWEILKIAKKNRADVIVLSGFPGVEDKENVKKALSEEYNAIYFMEKSKYDKSELIKRIVKIVENRDLRFVGDHRD